MIPERPLMPSLILKTNCPHWQCLSMSIGKDCTSLSQMAINHPQGLRFPIGTGRHLKHSDIFERTNRLFFHPMIGISLIRIRHQAGIPKNHRHGRLPHPTEISQRTQGVIVPHAVVPLPTIRTLPSMLLPGMHAQFSFPCIARTTGYLLHDRWSLMISNVFRVSLTKLPMLIHTLTRVRLEPSFIERRKYDAGQYTDHHNDHQKFHQRKRPKGTPMASCP
mgnify:FL=1